jgi:hypothetical protein
MTVRIQDNRFKESLFISLFSSVALGLIFNNTSDNQATHCILNLHSPLDSWFTFLTTRIAAHDNQVLFESVSFLEFWCGLFADFGNVFAPDRVQATAAEPTDDQSVLNLLQ